MKVGIPKESAAEETRVAGTPETVREFAAMGLEAVVEAGAGVASMIDDNAYVAAGARIEADPAAIWGECDIIIKVNAPARREGGGDEAALIREGAALVCLLEPTRNLPLVAALARRNITAFAMEAVPRIARAQSMDALSSMSTLAGYRAAILAAGALPKMMPLMMTAAGTLQPANALVIGAGVAGLEAIAVLRKLGANVKAIDVRAAVKEQVESLGAKFIPLVATHEPAEAEGGYARDLGEQFYRQEQESIAPHIKGADIVITSALIPHRRAPLLITEAMATDMAPGGVIVDLSAREGGNCSLTRPGQIVEARGLTIIGQTNLPAQMPVHASRMYARNVRSFLRELIKDKAVSVDLGNEVVRSMLVTHQGQVLHEATKAAMEAKLKETKP